MGMFQKLKENFFIRDHHTGGNEMYVIVGLGNPGKQYEGTKHNIGFEVIDWLAKDYTIDVTKFKHKALVGEGVICGKRVMLVKPQTYMNLSGESIREILKFYKVPLENFMVIYDDTSLPEGSVRLREKGSAGGHNGIKSIIAHLGTDVFLRAKVGIGEKPNGWDLADYVLAKFSKDSLPMVQAGIEKAAYAVELYLKNGVPDAMNHTNQKVHKTITQNNGDSKKNSQHTELKKG